MIPRASKILRTYPLRFDFACLIFSPMTTTNEARDINSGRGIFRAVNVGGLTYEICTRQFFDGAKTWEPARNPFVGSAHECIMEMHRRENIMATGYSPISPEDV